MMRFIRFPMGFAYRGLRNIDGTSGLARNIGERFSGINASVSALLANVVGSGGGLHAEYWSPAPHWKTTSTYGNGRLWAGGSNARTVTLNSIRTSDPTQYAAQIAAFTDAVINDLEYLHANVAPVRGFGLQNEGLDTTESNYGTCNYSAVEYQDVIKALIPKIRNSTALSTYGGQANSVFIHIDSWGGMADTAALWNSSTTLSTGKTALQEIGAQTYHSIVSLYQNPDWIKTNATRLRTAALGKPTYNNEFEYFDLSGISSGARFARTSLKMIHDLNLLDAPYIMPIIHGTKQLGQTSATSNTEGYALTKARLPAPFGEDPSTAGDSDPTIGFGQFGFINTNWNAAQFVTGNLPAGSKIRKVDLSPGGDGIGLVAAMVAGKLRVWAVNNSNTAKDVTITLPISATYIATSYTAPTAGAAFGTQTGSALTFSLPAYTGVVWKQDGAGTVVPVTPTVAISGAQSKPEGNSGATLYTYTVTRSATTGAVSVPWTFSPGTTSAEDYTGSAYPAGGTINLADGVPSGTFSVSVNGDADVEGNETFSVGITAPNGYGAGSAITATGTIVNDDSASGTGTVIDNDTFTRTALSNLSGSTSDSGGAWTSQPGATSGSPQISADGRVYSANTLALYRLGTVKPSADYTVAVDLVYLTGPGSATFGVMGRCSDTDRTYYEARWNGTNYAINLYSAGSVTPLATVPATFTSGTRRLALDMKSGVIRMLLDGVEIASVNDTTISAPGRAGIRFSGAGTSTTTIHLDNYETRTN